MSQFCIYPTQNVIMSYNVDSEVSDQDGKRVILIVMDLVCAQHMVTSLSQCTYWELHQLGIDMSVSFGES